MLKLKFQTILVISILVAGCDTLNWRSNVKVTYEVTGTANNVMINYSSGSDAVDQEKAIELPWSREVEVKRGREIYIMSRSLHEGERQLTAKILKDGEILDSTEVNASFAVAIARAKAK